MDDVLHQDDFEDEFADDFDALHSLEGKIYCCQLAAAVVVSDRAYLWLFSKPTEDLGKPDTFRRRLDFGKSSLPPLSQGGTLVEEEKLASSSGAGAVSRKRPAAWSRDLDADDGDDLDAMLGLAGNERHEPPAKGESCFFALDVIRKEITSAAVM